MKKKFLVVALSAAMAMTGILGGCSSSSSSTASTTAAAEAEEGEAETDSDDGGDFNPDNVEDSIDINGLREANGEEVPVAAGTELGVVMKSLSNEFWRSLQEGYETAAANSGANISIQATTDENDETGQQTMAETLTSQGVKALMMSPISDSNLTSATESANDAGVLTVNVDDGLIAQADIFVGPNAHNSGYLAAEWISEQLGDEGQVAIVIGMAKAFAARQRTQGFKDWLTDNNSNLELIAEQNADWDRTKSKDLAATWIQQYPDLKAIYCNNDTMALGVAEAVKEADSDILVVGTDGIGEAYDSIRSGGMAATVDYFPYYMGQIATEVTLRALAGQDIPRVVSTPIGVIHAGNVDDDPASVIGWTDTTYVAE